MSTLKFVGKGLGEFGGSGWFVFNEYPARREAAAAVKCDPSQRSGGSRCRRRTRFWGARLRLWNAHCQGPMRRVQQRLSASAVWRSGVPGKITHPLKWPNPEPLETLRSYIPMLRIGDQ